MSRLYTPGKKGLLIPERTPRGHRRYSKEALDHVLSSNGRQSSSELRIKKALCYARVSTRKQKDDLERQSQVLQNFCQANGMSYEVILDIGSGLNYKKAGLQQLTDAILSRKADCIVLTHRDRLLRFGYELIEYLCQKQGIQILCISQDEKPDSSQELAEDVLAVLTVFSSRLYGKRSHKNKLIVETNRKLFELSTREDHDENEKENKPDPQGSEILHSETAS